jgi:hypothetical protein
MFRGISDVGARAWQDPLSYPTGKSSLVGGPGATVHDSLVRPLEGEKWIRQTTRDTRVREGALPILQRRENRI